MQTRYLLKTREKEGMTLSTSHSPGCQKIPDAKPGGREEAAQRGSSPEKQNCQPRILRPVTTAFRREGKSRHAQMKEI